MRRSGPDHDALRLLCHLRVRDLSLFGAEKAQSARLAAAFESTPYGKPKWWLAATRELDAVTGVGGAPACERVSRWLYPLNFKDGMASASRMVGKVGAECCPGLRSAP